MLQCEVHKVHASGLPKLIDRLTWKIKITQYLEEPLKNNLLSLIARLDNDSDNLCHGDFHPLNILYDGSKHWIIDWVDGYKNKRDFAKSVWSEKNKKIVEALQEKGLMNDLGEQAVEMAKKNGIWDAPKGNPITDEQIEAFTKKLFGISPAYENFNNMPPSVRRTYTARYLSFKTEEARQRDLERIVDRLNQNLKPM